MQETGWNRFIDGRDPDAYRARLGALFIGAIVTSALTRQVVTKALMPMSRTGLLAACALSDVVAHPLLWAAFGQFLPRKLGKEATDFTASIAVGAGLSWTLFATSSLLGLRGSARELFTTVGWIGGIYFAPFFFSNAPRLHRMRG